MKKEVNLKDSANFLNRELSWLDFNFRVLAEAENPDVPPLDRLKFIAIVASNLDEFTTVRIANTIRAKKNGARTMDISGLSPEEVLRQMSQKKHEMIRREYACLYNDIFPALAQAGIELIRSEKFTQEDRKFLSSYYEDNVLPALTPLAIDPGHPFPLLASGALYLLFRVSPMESSERIFGTTDMVLVQMPGVLSRFIRLPAQKGEIRMAALDDIIRLFSENLLGGYKIHATHAFRVLRDAEMIVDDESADDLLGAINEAVRSRRWGDPVALAITDDTPDEVVQDLRGKLNLEDEEAVFRQPWLLDLKSLFAFIAQIDRPELMEEPWPPQDHPGFTDLDVFTAMRQRDILVHLPYQKFDPVVDLVSRAAEDPKVLAIKITLYRVSGDSPVVKALMRAADNGKQVTALVELRARFDEAANIGWAKALDSAGAHVIYGVVGYKTHSKVLLVVRREKDGIRRYVHLGTGNYNDKTARVYTDLGLFTTRPEIGQDVSGFFNVITGYSLPPRWNCITMAPLGLRKKILSLIHREMETHTPETPGVIRAKMNSLIDPEVIRALYEASIKGVRIDLLVRGLCRLRPGMPGISENSRVYSILDRFLEHPRIFHFRNGGNDEVYLASADWMERNFDMRLELMFPVIDPECRAEALAVLDAGFGDNLKAWRMLPEGAYERVAKPTDKAKHVRSQQALYERACQQSKGNRRTPEGTFIAKTRPGRSKS